MIAYSDDMIKIIRQTPFFTADGCSFTEAEAMNALRFHRSLPGYAETALVSLSCAAEQYAVDSIFVEDESSRFVNGVLGRIARTMEGATPDDE